MELNDVMDFIVAFDLQRFQAFLDQWMLAHTADDIRALCDFLGYDPIAELAELERLERLRAGERLPLIPPAVRCDGL